MGVERGRMKTWSIERGDDFTHLPEIETENLVSQDCQMFGYNFRYI